MLSDNTTLPSYPPGTIAASEISSLYRCFLERFLRFFVRDFVAFPYMNTAIPTMAAVTTPLMAFSAMFVQSSTLHPSTLVSFLMSVTGVSRVIALCSSRIRSQQA